MSDLEQRISHLEDLLEEMQLETHSSKVAIAVISTALNGVIGKETNLGEMFLTGVANAEKFEFDHPAPDEYREKLYGKVAALLGKLN